MRLRSVFLPIVIAALAALLAACGGNNMCTLGTNEGCSSNQVCENVRGGTRACFAPVEVRGRVFDLASNANLEGARVMAIDPEGTAVSGVATTMADGTYTLQVPAERNMNGTIASASFTLRAEAANYQTFPSGVRPALPVDTSSPTAQNETGARIENTTTSIGMIALPAGMRGSIEGRIDGAMDRHGGVLIVGGGSATVSNRDGTFVLFNVTPGAVTLRGFAAGLQLRPAMATVTAGMATRDVVLSASTDALSTVSGNVQIVNGGGAANTTVVLVPRETFNENLDRGEVPRGLRLPNIQGNFQFTEVPDGEYVVLAAFGNDGLVRDPDTSIGGTALVYVTVPMGTNRAIALSSGFKVTGALAVRGPGTEAPEAVTGAMPTLRWADDSSEDGYEVRVFDAFGTMVWMTELPNVSGGGEVSVPYAGPLNPGMYYQFRATSFRNDRMGRVNISRTEELRGVFYRGM